MHNVPKDLINLIISFVFDVSADELFRDLRFYIKWQTHVPGMFLTPALLDIRYFYAVANPMIKDHPYTPRRFLQMRPSEIWASTLPALVNMLCPQKIREIKTYKGCVQRWVHDCVSSRNIQLYFILCKKALVKVSERHFRRAFPVFFVREALRQTRALYDSSFQASP